MREERREREEQERIEALKTAPSASGILDLLPDGYGFMRTSGYLPGPDDIYVSMSQVRKHQLRKGDVVTGKVRQPRDNEKYWALLEVEKVNDMDPTRRRRSGGTSTSSRRCSPTSGSGSSPVPRP